MMVSVKRAMWLVLALLLPACEMETGSTVDPAHRPVRAVALQATGMSVAGPSGYCVDPASVRDSDKGSFALLGNCSGLNGHNNPALKGKTAVLTVSISAPMADTDEFDAPSLEAYFASETGRKTLSRQGSARTVQLIDSETRDDMVLIHVRDSAPMTLRGQGEEYWRAIFMRQGRLVTATATPFAEAPMPEDRLRALLDRFTAEFKRRNPT